MSDRPGRRRGRIRRRSEAVVHPVPAAPETLRPPRRPRLPFVLALFGGILIGRFVFAMIPVEAHTLFDFAIAGAFALALTMTYRRYMRRYMAEQRRRRS